ncbi:uncharacterized protein TNCV_5105041 [Trichonephila clavipes]|nr:uncharacterized protein TNCV_5105041 [Trichonephila clavipes]
MLIVFFDKNGVVYSEFVPEGQTVNGAFYVEVLKRLKRQPRPCPSRLFLFPKVKTVLKGCYHGTLDYVKRACTHALKDVSVGDFQGVYEAWKRRLQKIRTPDHAQQCRNVDPAGGRSKSLGFGNVEDQSYKSDRLSGIRHWDYKRENLGNEDE